MKEAALKEKPERRQWEEAASFFKWTCGNYDHVHHARKLPFQQRLAAGEAFRAEGNSAYVEERYPDALMQCGSLPSKALPDALVVTTQHGSQHNSLPEVCLRIEGPGLQVLPCHRGVRVV